jgi:hypothetical protein
LFTVFVLTVILVPPVSLCLVSLLMAPWRCFGGRSRCLRGQQASDERGDQQFPLVRLHAQFLPFCFLPVFCIFDRHTTGNQHTLRLNQPEAHFWRNNIIVAPIQDTKRPFLE